MQQDVGSSDITGKSNALQKDLALRFALPITSTVFLLRYNCALSKIQSKFITDQAIFEKNLKLKMLFV